MPEQVKCKDCGYLSVRSALDSLVYPADEDTRKTANTKTHLDYRTERTSGCPMPIGTDWLICYRGYSGFVENVESSMTPKALIGTERTCPHFRRWIAGKTPKEHEDMEILEQVGSQQRTTRIIAMIAAAGTVASSIIALIALYVSLSH